jgi:beta-N-acetylhexosaminidase
MNMRAMRTEYDPIDAATQAMNAGVDIVMLAEEHYDHDSGYLSRQVALIEGVGDAVREGRISEARLDEAVGRVLRLKAGIVEVASEPDTVGSEAHRSIELEQAKSAVALLRGTVDLLPVSVDPEITLVNTTRREAYEILGSTRGIGPNQTDPAFDLFVEAVRRRSPDVRAVSAEDVLMGSIPDGEGLIVAVTENHPLPGVDFDVSTRDRVLEMLMSGGGRVLVVALRDPYELAELPDVADYLCAFGPRAVSAEAAAQVLFGEFEADGESPVSVPGAGIEAR